MSDFFYSAIELLKAGGVLMAPLAALAFYLYYLGFEICFKVIRWNRICAKTECFDSAFSAFSKSEFSGVSETGDIKRIFSHLRMSLLSGIERRLFVLKVLSGVPTLIGLLGTVAGMMLSISSSAAQDAGAVADGISVALITTQAGLTVAIPAWIIAMFASSQIQKLLINIARRESALIKGAAR